MTLYTKPRAELFAQDAPSSEIKPFTAWLRGLGIAFDETNGFPEMESFNGLLQSLNGYIKYLEQNGFAEWSNTLEYPVGAGVRVGAVWYRAKEQNLNKPPATSQNEWAVFLNASDLSFSDPLQVVGGVISIKDASTTQKGVTRFATATEVSNRTNVTAAVTPANVAAMIEQFPTVRASVKSGSNGGVFGGIGFSSVVRLGTGYFEFTLSSPAPNTNYIVMLTSSWGGNLGAASVSLDPNFAQTTTKFRAVCLWGGDNTNGSFDPVTLNAIVIY